MSSYVFKRLLWLPPLLMGISFLAFALISLSPSDPAEVALRVNEIMPTVEAVEAMRAELGLEKPFLSRYADWLRQLARMDLGTSYITRRPVAEEILPAIGPTVRLALVTLGLIVVSSVILGVMCAIYEGGWVDYLGRAFVFISTSMPNFWVGLLLLWLFAVKLDLLPLGGMEAAESVILPAVTLALAYAGTYVRLIRASVLANLKSPYAAYAAVRGLPKKTIVWKHVLPNSLQSAVTAMGMSIPKLIAGTVVVENIFAWPGLGRLCVKAIFDRDLPVLQAYILVIGGLFVVFNFAADLVQLRLDPRLRPGEAE